MNTILGNNFLISIAYKAESPTQAAKTAQLMGYTREQVRAVRNAAVLKRDQGQEEFDKQFQPYDLVDLNIQQCKTMTIRMFIDKTYETRPLNVAEFNEVADHLIRELKKLGITANVALKPHYPYAKSNIISKE